MNHSNILVNCVIAMHAVWEAYSPEIFKNFTVMKNKLYRITIVKHSTNSNL